MLTIYLREPGTPLNHSGEAEPGLILNYTEDNSLSSIEIMDASKRYPAGQLLTHSLDEFINLRTASELSKIAPVTLRTQADKGKLWAIRLGRQWITTRDRLQQYIESRSRKATIANLYLNKPTGANMSKTVSLPLTKEAIQDLRSGDNVLLKGTMLVARDAAHKRIAEALDKNEPLPFELKGQTIYYMGPTPGKPGQAIGSAGPTTSGRMDIYTPRLLEAGLKGMIGKGMRSSFVKEAIRKQGAVYLAAIGGTGALISKTIKKAEVIAYRELGAEAVLRIEVEDFPATVINDIYGGDLYEEGRRKYRK